MVLGQVRFVTAMLFSLAFMMTFVLGGFSGIIFACPPLFYFVHNTLVLVAHLHAMLIPGLVSGIFAASYFWFATACEFRLSERAGADCVRLLGGRLYLAFMPLYVLDAAGMARRTQKVFEPAFRLWLYVAEAGALVHRIVPAAEVEGVDRRRLDAVGRTVSFARKTEMTTADRGWAAAGGDAFGFGCSSPFLDIAMFSTAYLPGLIR